MSDQLTAVQKKRVQLLLHEWTSIPEFMNVLQRVESSVELQEFIKHYNWDRGYEPIELMMQHPLCDRGTALEAYWLGQPHLFAYIPKAEDIPSYNRDLYHFHRLAESILLADNFQHRAVVFDPLSSYLEEKRCSIAKYAQIPDELLLPTGVDSAQRQAAIDKLNDYRATPDDSESLKYLAEKYWRMHDYEPALTAIDRSLSLAPSRVRNWTLKQSILKDLEKLHKLSTTASEGENTYPSSYPDINQVRQEMLKCLESLIQIELDQSKPKSNTIVRYQCDMADLYLQLEDFSSAVELLESLLAKAQTEEIPRYALDPRIVTKRMVEAYQALGNFERASHYLDVWLNDSLPDGYLCFQKVNLLQAMGRTDDANALLNQIVDRKAREIAAKKADGNPTSSDFSQMATLLENYRRDYRGAANILQEIIDLGLCNSINNESKLLSRIKKLRAQADESI